MNPGATYTPDPRDAGFAASKQVALPTENIFDQSMNWETGPILDQGFTQQCLAESAAGLMAAAPFKHPGVDPDRLYAEMCAIDGRVHEPDDTGSNVHALMTILQRRKLIESYLWLTTATEVWSYILNHGPVGLIFPWTDDMEILRDDGTLNLPKKFEGGPYGNIRGGHCVYLPAVRNNVDTGMHLIRAVNSRGPAWGDGGRFWWNFGELNSTLRIPGSIAFALSKTKYTAK